MEKPLPLSPITSDNGERLNIYYGITDQQIDQLIQYTNSDPDIKKFTSDFSRFPDRASFDKWSQDKYIYTLSNSLGDLLGLVWFEIKQIPLLGLEDYGITIAIRIYGRIRGKGYFNPFLKHALVYFKETEDYQKQSNKGIWVSIHKENTPSKKAFEKFGFRRIENQTIPNRVFMVLEN